MIKQYGTPYYLAPEVLRYQTGPTKEADVYAFGILIYEGEDITSPVHVPVRSKTSVSKLKLYQQCFRVMIHIREKRRKMFSGLF